ncbi:MAG: hypothetical protein OEN01_16445, partial [Candidatus Krumholzibacteria bacterium]|nr:hypothetical protein [Candidatus Krumholzibacteria bacterium]
RAIAANTFPGDWKYYTLTLPVGRYNHLTREDIYREMDSCNRRFYSLRRVLSRFARNLLKRRKPIFTLVANLSNRNNMRMHHKAFREFTISQDAPRAKVTVRRKTAMAANATKVASR